MEYANFLVGSIAALTGFIAFRKSFMLNITQSGTAIKEDWSEDVYACSFFISPKSEFIDSFTVVASPNMEILGCCRNGSRIREPEQNLPKRGTKSLKVPIGTMNAEQFFIYLRISNDSTRSSSSLIRKLLSYKERENLLMFLPDEFSLTAIKIMQMAFMVKQIVVK